MNVILQRWLAARVNTPGMFAAGVRLPDAACLGETVDDNFPREKIEKILQQAADVQPQLLDANLPLRWSTWIFEQGKMRLVARPDNLLLVLLVRPDTDAALNLDLFSNEFLMLDLQPTATF